MKTKKLSLVIIALILSLLSNNISYIYAQNYETIDTTSSNFINTYGNNPLYINDDINIIFPNNLEVQSYKNQIIYDNSSIELPKVSPFVKYISDSIGQDKFINLRESGILLVEGDLLKFGKTQSYQGPYGAAKHYFDEDSNEILNIKGNIINTIKTFKVFGKNENVKILIEPFDKNILGTRFTSGIEGLVPKITIFDDIKLAIELSITTNSGKGNKIYYPEMKYKIYKYIVDIPNNKGEKQTGYSYIISPYYEFNLQLPSGENELSVNYKSYKGDQNSFRIINYK
ncbi:MAG: hypothetical protein PHH06_03825 [Candidatus Gracilibacteria bacterium]|nr:hypothetical protein [Candidatus Gracilibacteria bacterium]